VHATDIALFHHSFAYQLGCLRSPSPSPAHAVFHSAPTETDGSVIRPSRRSGTQSLAWTGPRPVSHDIWAALLHLL
jgi:hypothetical protein